MTESSHISATFLDCVPYRLRQDSWWLYHCEKTRQKSDISTMQVNCESTHSKSGSIQKLQSVRDLSYKLNREEAGMPHILIADDDAHIADVITFALEKMGYTYSVAKNGAEALDLLDPTLIDLIILDVGMPEMDGLQVCREIRKTSEIPILFLSARDEEIDRILGLEIGGDDYVTKPFSPRELVARIGAILKRASNTEQKNDENVLTQGDLELDPNHRSSSFNDQNLKMTAIEFNILHALMARPKMAFTREQILNAAWPDNIHVSDRTIDSHIRNLRAKLNVAGCTNAVETVHGIGFRLGPCR